MSVFSFFKRGPITKNSSGDTQKKSNADTFKRLPNDLNKLDESYRVLIRELGKR